jgi:hypothetical protein
MVPGLDAATPSLEIRATTVMKQGAGGSLIRSGSSRSS